MHTHTHIALTHLSYLFEMFIFGGNEMPSTAAATKITLVSERAEQYFDGCFFGISEHLINSEEKRTLDGSIRVNVSNSLIHDSTMYHLRLFGHLHKNVLSQFCQN